MKSLRYFKPEDWSNIPPDIKNSGRNYEEN